MHVISAPCGLLILDLAHKCVRMRVFFLPHTSSFSFSGLHTPEEVPGGSVPATGAKIYYTVIVVAF